MTKEKKQRIYELVKEICKTAPEGPTEKTRRAARRLLDEAGVSKNARIREIPLYWGGQAAIRFTLGEYDRDNNSMTFVVGAGVNREDPTQFFFTLQVENDHSEFPVEAEDDIGVYLIEALWTIKNGQIVD